MLVDEVDILERVREKIRSLDMDLVPAGIDSLKVYLDNSSNMVKADPVSASCKAQCLQDLFQSRSSSVM